MSDNPRLILAAFWLMAGLRSFAAAGDSHTTVVLVGNIVGAVLCPVWAYFELRQGLRDRRRRLAGRP